MNKDKSQARRHQEHARVEAVRAQGRVPENVGPVVEAPARGPVKVREMLSYHQRDDGRFQAVRAGFAGRRTMQRADVWDLMAARAAAKRKVAPFAEAQVSMARHYRDMIERQEAGGLRALDLDRVRSGAGGSYIDAVLSISAQIEAMRARIPCGDALVPVRGGRMRQAISRRALVDAVCLGEQTISEVLRGAGWSASGQLVAVLQADLAASLTAMMGRSRVCSGVVHFA